MVVRKVATKKAVPAATKAHVAKVHTLPTAEEVVEAFSKALALLSLFDGPAGDPIPGTPKAASKKVKPAPVEEDEDEEDEDEEADDEEDEDEDEADSSDRRAELEGMGIRALRTLAKQFFDDADVKDADKETLVENILSADSEEEPDVADVDEDEEDEADEEEADEDEEAESEYDPDELAELGVVALKNLCVEAGYVKTDLAGYKKDDLIGLLIPEEEDEADEEDEEEAGEDEEPLTEEELEGMSLAELKTLAVAYGLTVPKPAKKDALIADILEAAEEE